VCQRSLKVIENGTIWKIGYGFLFAFHSNYDCIFGHFGDIQHQRTIWLEVWVRGHSRSLKMARFDRPCMTFYGFTIVTIAQTCTVFELFEVEYYRDLEIWLRGHSRSLKLVPLESLDAVSYSNSIVTMAISRERFSVNEWRDLENQVRGPLRSLKMAPFDRPYATFCWSAIVNKK